MDALSEQARAGVVEVELEAEVELEVEVDGAACSVMRVIGVADRADVVDALA